MRLADLLSGSVEPEAPGRFGLTGLAERLANESPWKHKPPTPEEFIYSDYWIGALSQDKNALPDAIRQEWCKSARAEISEAILSGGIGTFKTQRAVLLMEYLAALHQCLHDPGSFYGLGAGAEMDIAFVSVNRQAAKDVGFDRLASFIAQSPFFQEHAKPDPKFSSELRFKGLTIKPAVSNERGIISRALLGLVMDEAAFMDVSQKSRRARGAETTYDAAFNIYSQALVRMKSRFVRDGQPVPYKIVIASSAQFPDDFVSRRRMQVEQERLEGVHVSDMSLWEAKPDAYSKHTFRVEVGDELHFPRILKDGEDPRQGSRVVYPPMDFLPDFERDIDRAIRDIAGLPLQTLAPLISERRKVTDCIRTVDKGYTPEQCEHPFTHEVTSLVDGCRILSDLLCKRGGDGLLYPCTNPSTVRFIHLDPSFGRQDPFGFAMVHATGFSEGTWRNPRTGQVEEKYSVQVYVDAMLRIVKPNDGSDISIGDIETLLRQFQEHGYEIGLVTSDNQGAFLLNRLNQLGYETEILSVDRTTDPYLNLRSAFNEGRISMYHYEPVIEELFHLEWNKQRNKVDHGHRFCLAGDTRIPTLDGKCPQISELDGKETWVYSVTPEGKFAPGRARGFKTKEVTELLDVLLDSGAVFRCTPDHRCMLLDGTYKEARDLRPGVDRLMPMNRFWPSAGGYESLSCGNDPTTYITHRAIAEAVLGPIPEDCVVHHKDGVKTNNCPSNLEIVSKSHHSFRHTVERWENDAEYGDKVRAGLQAFNLSPEGRRKHADAIRRTTAAMTPEQRRARARKRIFFRSDVTPAALARVRDDPDATTANGVARLLNCGRNVIVRVLKDVGYKSWEDYRRLEPRGNNHKVRLLIPVKLGTPVPVYDLEVDTYSNFALAAGVVVHNSKDVSDALAGAVFMATTRGPEYDTGGRKVAVSVY